MRIVKRCHLLLLFSLALLLVCGQLPELFTLIDDVSNDFVEESFEHISKSVESAPIHSESQRTVTFEEESHSAATVAPSNQPLPSISPDLLRLFAMQRK